jgi:hypothetical protein
MATYQTNVKISMDSLTYLHKYDLLVFGSNRVLPSLHTEVAMSYLNSDRYVTVERTKKGQIRNIALSLVVVSVAGLMVFGTGGWGITCTGMVVGLWALLAYVIEFRLIGFSGLNGQVVQCRPPGSEDYGDTDGNGDRL